RALGSVIEKEIVASAHGIYRGGLGVHLTMVAMGGDLGMKVDLALVPACASHADRPSVQVNRIDTLLFSESAGRFIVTIDPENRKTFEDIFKGLPCSCIGVITDKSGDLVISDSKNRGKSKIIISIPVQDLKAAWKKPFGGLI
ncbi:MAG: phosphoribosylformylglycinamidine synthase, partial [Proteobacteria bacterium]|nr:phosphoribosylformylglycinamidine synthase [Pseudomonadota bacterium]